MFVCTLQIKKMNRKLEFLLQHVELFQSVGYMRKLIGNYPSDVLDRLWKQLLLNQFHDVLPGSCIKEVVLSFWVKILFKGSFQVDGIFFF